MHWSMGGGWHVRDSVDFLDAGRPQLAVQGPSAPPGDVLGSRRMLRRWQCKRCDDASLLRVMSNMQKQQRHANSPVSGQTFIDDSA